MNKNKFPLTNKNRFTQVHNTHYQQYEINSSSATEIFTNNNMQDKTTHFNLKLSPFRYIEGIAIWWGDY